MWLQTILSSYALCLQLGVRLLAQCDGPCLGVPISRYVNTECRAHGEIARGRWLPALLGSSWHAYSGLRVFALKWMCNRSTQFTHIFTIVGEPSEHSPYPHICIYICLERQWKCVHSLHETGRWSTVVFRQAPPIPPYTTETALRWLDADPRPELRLDKLGDKSYSRHCQCTKRKFRARCTKAEWQREWKRKEARSKCVVRTLTFFYHHNVCEETVNAYTLHVRCWPPSTFLKCHERFVWRQTTPKMLRFVCCLRLPLCCSAKIAKWIKKNTHTHNRWGIRLAELNNPHKSGCYFSHRTRAPPKYCSSVFIVCFSTAVQCSYSKLKYVLHSIHTLLSHCSLHSQSFVFYF